MANEKGDARAIDMRDALRRFVSAIKRWRKLTPRRLKLGIPSQIKWTLSELLSSRSLYENL